MAYAAVTSLMGTLDQHFLQPEPRLLLEDKQKIASLHENLGLLQEILEKSKIASDNAAMKDLEAQIRDVLFKAEERIEMELSTIYLAKGRTKRLRACLLRLHEIFNEAVKQTADYLKNELIRIKSDYQLAKGSSQNERISDVSLLGSTSSQPDLERENITVRKFSKNASKFDSRMVGCNEEFMMILDQLTRQSAQQRQVVSIVGMGGIGKTTLAQKVYEDPSITSYFDKRAWVTVSQQYNTGEILQCLIACFGASSDELFDKDKLPERLYKRLKGQRYLIVIDDIWSTTPWDSVQRCFPDDNNGSRILLISRLREVAEYASSGYSLVKMRFLDADESWNLYCKVFGKTEFLFEFERIGRDIVKKCEGLPLAIIVVASLLSKTGEKVEKWKNFAENVSRSVIGDSNEACSRVLSLSYNQLPHELKACFLYFGVFPEDYEIPVKRLVRLWAAEGFLRAVNHRNPEEVGMECLQDLVDRSLVIVSKQSYNGKMKTIRIHDLLRDLCLREAQHENLLNVIGYDYSVSAKILLFFKRISQHLCSEPCRWITTRSVYFDDYSDAVDCHCFQVYFFDASDYDYDAAECYCSKGNRGRYLDNLIRSKCFDKLHSFINIPISEGQERLFSHFKLLRVVDVENLFNNGGRVLNVLANLVHLRYLALTYGPGYFSFFDVKLFEHWNMQSFIVRGCGVTLDSSRASGIWKMPLLRNFYVEEILSLQTCAIVHRNLETISWLEPKCCTKDLFTRIPNLKKLGIRDRLFSENPDCFYNFVHLGQLEKLSIRGWHLKGIPCSGIPWATSFLPNLKKLNFISTVLPWSDMSLIGMLPNLEVLKLINACKGGIWEPYDGGFCRLKRLVIEMWDTDLEYWNAEGDHFPVLECLELRKCYSLRKIPSGFADITTLALIQLNECLDSLLASAKWIQDEQHSYGNDALLVCSNNIWVSFYPSNISLTVSHFMLVEFFAEGFNLSEMDNHLFSLT